MKLLRIAVCILSVALAATAWAESDAQKSFRQLTTLAGSWEGKGMGNKPVQVSFRVVSNGSAVMSEIQGDEDMITMFHLDGDRLMMTHYCATGNQPRMLGTMSPDGKTLTFDFLDVTNLAGTPGHMQHLVFTITDANHHSEEWTFLDKDGTKQMHEHFELQRKP